jgi:putative endopeptidase
MRRIPLRLLLASSSAALAALALPAAPALAGAPPAAATVATEAAAQPPKPLVFGTWGVDLAARDLSVKPGDDFAAHAWGAWDKATAIPADQPAAGVGFDIFNLTNEQLRAVVAGAPADGQLGALYRSFMDEARVERVGAAPLLADVRAIRAIRTPAAMARAMGASLGGFGIAPFGPSAYADTDTPTLTTLWLTQAGLGLPEREYYLAETFKPQRDAYAAYIERTLRSVGDADPAGNAARMLALETEIARASWPAADRRDLTKINNPMSLAELERYAPGFAWRAFFAGAGIAPQQRIVVNENTAIRDIAAIVGRTPLATLKAWQAFHTAFQASPYLSKAFVDSRFEFIRTLTGVSEIRPRWKRGLTLVDGSLGELAGRTYVERYFGAEAKAEMEELVRNLKLAMADRIRSNDWMAPATKTAALEKLARMDVMVGYPDKWRDYSALRLTPTDLYGNVKRSRAFEWAYGLEDLGKPVDRKKWAMTPQTVNAYNGGLENKIVFPAGILQAPMFSLAADDAVNYGAIGSVIGHEITHGFDDQGRKIDASGAVRDWWTTEDAARYEAKAAELGKQYATYEAAPGMFINPALTMGENLADLAGLQIALDAYRKSLGGKPAPVIDGLTGEQRFFLAYAQAWRGKLREAAVRQQLTADPHSPERWRVIGPTRNMDAWYEAFAVKPGDKYYLPPEQRVRIW